MEFLIICFISIIMFSMLIKFGFVIIESAWKIFSRVAWFVCLPLAIGLIYNPDGTFLVIAKFIKNIADIFQASNLS